MSMWNPIVAFGKKERDLFLVRIDVGGDEFQPILVKLTVPSDSDEGDVLAEMISDNSYLKAEYFDDGDVVAFYPAFLIPLDDGYIPDDLANAIFIKLSHSNGESKYGISVMNWSRDVMTVEQGNFVIDGESIGDSIHWNLLHSLAEVMYELVDAVEDR